jgi:hypothetical protein
MLCVGFNTGFKWSGANNHHVTIIATTAIPFLRFIITEGPTRIAALQFTQTRPAKLDMILMEDIQT